MASAVLPHRSVGGKATPAVSCGAPPPRACHPRATASATSPSSLLAGPSRCRAALVCAAADSSSGSVSRGLFGSNSNGSSAQANANSFPAGSINWVRECGPTIDSLDEEDTFEEYILSGQQATAAAEVKSEVEELRKRIGELQESLELPRDVLAGGDLDIRMDTDSFDDIYSLKNQVPDTTIPLHLVLSP